MIQQNVAAESSGFSFSCSTRSRAHSCHWQLISKTTSPWEQGPTINCWSRSGLWWWYLHWDPRWDSTGLHWGHPLGSFHSLCMWRPFFHLCFLSSEESWDLLPLSWHCCLPPPVWSLCAPQLLLLPPHTQTPSLSLHLRCSEHAPAANCPCSASLYGFSHPQVHKHSSFVGSGFVPEHDPCKPYVN